MEGKFATRVREVVRASLLENEYQLAEDECAEVFKMSGRSLRRFLKRLSAPTYRQIMSSEINERAQHLLVSTNYPISIVARMCGYAHHPAFTRAFDRWNGELPKDFRAKRASIFTLIGREPKADPCALGHE